MSGSPAGPGPPSPPPAGADPTVAAVPEALAAGTTATRREALKVGWGIAPVSFVFAVAFGAYAVAVGMPAVAAVVMSLVMFSGGAQFAMVSLASAGAGLVTAGATGMLLNSRYLLMGASVASALRGRWWRRVAEASTLNDPSWVVAVGRDGSVDRTMLLWSALGQYLAWGTGTVVGVLLGPRIGSIESVGFDTVMPMFFVSLLIADLRGRPDDDRSRASRMAVFATVATLLLAPIAPPGVPVLVAVAATLLVWRRSLA